MNDRPRFQEHLRLQLGFIRNSCEAYDRGARAEGVRIGTALRVILYQSQAGQGRHKRDKRRGSTSLLTHLDAVGVPLLSTCRPPIVEPPRRIQNFDGLALFTSDGFFPKLDRGSFSDFLPSSQWWEQTVAMLGGRPITRRDFVLAAVDKDGGAHVDADLPADYQAFLEGIWQYVATGERVPGYNLLYLRQMGHEILNSPELARLTQPEGDDDGSTR